MKKLNIRDDMTVELKIKQYYYLDSAIRYKYDENQKRTDEVEGMRIDTLIINEAGERKTITVTIPKVIDTEGLAFGTPVRFQGISVTPYFDRSRNSLEFSVKAEDMVVSEKK